MSKIRNYKVLVLLVSMMLLTFYLHSQEKKQTEEIKSLVIIDGKKNLWTKQQKNDSINWLNVKSINVLSDSIRRIELYGEKAKYGVMIIKYNK